MRRKRGSALRRIGLAAAAVLVLFLGTGSWFRWFYPDRQGPGSGREVEVSVPRGSGPSRVARLLARAGVIEHPRIFALYLRTAGFARNLSAGLHVLRDDWSPREVARALTRPGRGAQRRLTLREGWTRFEMGRQLEAAGIVSARGFLEATEDVALLQAHGIPGPSAEGYLFPETYMMTPGTPAAAVVARLIRTFERRTAPLFAGRRDQLTALGREMMDLQRRLGAGPYSEPLERIEPEIAGRHAVVVLASLVEAETALESERPRVAAVAFNRLRSPSFPSRLLQFDPTVSYGCLAEPRRAPSCSDESSALTRRQLADPANRYNTYRHPGLPPGPIGNPSLSALRAVLDPAETDDLYFVADGRGGHVFSETLQEHNRAVARYRAATNEPSRDADVAAGGDGGEGDREHR